MLYDAAVVSKSRERLRKVVVVIVTVGAAFGLTVSEAERLSSISERLGKGQREGSSKGSMPVVVCFPLLICHSGVNPHLFRAALRQTSLTLAGSVFCFVLSAPSCCCFIRWYI